MYPWMIATGGRSDRFPAMELLYVGTRRQKLTWLREKSILMQFLGVRAPWNWMRVAWMLCFHEYAQRHVSLINYFCFYFVALKIVKIAMV